MWKTYNIYVDIDTGEQLNENVAKTDYIIINKIKKTTYNATTAKGTIRYTNECQRSRQLGLFE